MNIDEKHSDSEYLISLGKKVKEIRLSKKISQTEIAYRCGFDKSNYNTIESGKRNPTITSLLKIAKALDVKVVELLDF
ncbi:helix-turn-helix domain-containing protein [Flavobacterium sp.]|uniref:helix-turn-helix domain-containing protein n=1 Tax=Flavobacterium sp. TaxID=239 RepID=UPI003752C0A4